MEHVNEIIEILNLWVREARHYSFGDAGECKKDFIYLFKAVDKTTNVFRFLPEYNEIVDWMTDTQGKGLALFGSVGRGKTVINSFIIPILFYYKYHKVMRPVNAYRISSNDLLRWAYIIDDIGTENMVNDFGNKKDMVAMMINDAEHNIKPLFLTSNLTHQELISRYGTRTIDRIGRLCRVIIFKGKSERL